MRFANSDQCPVQYLPDQLQELGRRQLETAARTLRGMRAKPKQCQSDQIGAARSGQVRYLQCHEGV